MRYDKYYEKLNALASMELFGYDESMALIEGEFSSEHIYLTNMTLEKFSKEDERSMFEILRLYDIYFRNGHPLISDSFFDGLNEVYQKISGCASETPTDIIMFFEPSIDAWEKHEHTMVMGSLDKQSTVEEIEKWNMKKHIQGVHSIVSEKLDGISLEVIYKRGIFERAVTRGDGKKGDDITKNAIYFDGMNKTINEPWDCAIRGEVIITKDNLIEINKILKKQGKEPLKNARNGVAGQATRYKDRNEDILSLITFIAYDIQIYKVYETHENVI